MRSPFRIASAQYDIGFLPDWTAFAKKIHRWVGEAAKKKAKLLVFPEYFSMELASLFGEEVYRSLDKQLAALQEVVPAFIDLFQSEAEQRGVHILAGSIPVRYGNGYRNRAYFFTPDGGPAVFQDKLQMARFENEKWFISGGDEIKVFGDLPRPM